MPRHAFRTLLVLVAAGGAALAMSVRHAGAQAGWYVLPSIAVTEVFDDNIFASSGSRSADAITRVSPGLGLGYRSTPLTVLGSASVDAELFAVHGDQSGLNRKQVRLDVESRPDQTLTLKLRGVFDQTETPTDLTQNLAVQLGRTRATQFVVSPEVSYRFDRRFTGEAAYIFTTNTASDITNTLHEVRLSLSSQLTPRDLGRVTYHLRRGDSDGLALAADSITAGWVRRLSETTTVSVAAGPRFSDGGVDLEASASVTHRLSNGDLRLAFERTESTVVGQRGFSTTTSLSGDLTLKPWRSLTLSITPHVAELTGGGLNTTTYGSEFTARYEFTRRFELITRYSFSYQKGSSGNVGGSGDIIHNIVSIGLNFRMPERVY